ncbi:hypothetical protein [Gaopeijia maritima]|uniref:YfhO family protein n=1 Tax=Gaopeijia maritima TaxID=3119007 RepID=A0ABU9E634_9BACT
MRNVADPSGPLDRAPEHLALPAWLPPVVYAVVTLVLFRAFAFSDAMLFGSDTQGLGYMARAFYAEALKSGDFPLWNPIILGGTPFLESLAGGDSLYPPSMLLLLLLEPYRALGWKLALHLWIAGMAMFGWSRALGASRAASFVAGLGYMVAPFFVSLAWPAHDGKMFVTALTPLLFWAVESWFARGRLGALAGIGAVVALAILTTHFQMAYFLFGAVGAYALFRAVQQMRLAKDAAEDGSPEGNGAAEPGGERPTRTAGTPPRAMASPWMRFAVFVGASVVGAGAAGVQLLPALDYIGDASRRSQTTTQATPEENRAYAASWGMHPEEAVSSLFVPEFAGASTNEGSWTDGTYWGRNAFKLNSEYIGLALLLLAIVGFFGGRRRGVRIFMAAMGGVALLYTLQTWTPVWGLFYALVPGLKLFRAPSMVIFLSGFAVATLAAFGVDRALSWTVARRSDEGKNAGKVLVGAAVLLGLGMLAAQGGVLFDLWTAVFYGDMPPGKLQALQAATPFIARGFLLATLVALAVGGILHAGAKGWLQPSGVIGLLAVLVVFDGGRVSDRFLSTTDFDAFAVRGPVEDFLLERQSADEPFRVLDLGGAQALGGDVRMGVWGLHLAGGHHPNDLRRYRELTGMVGGGTPDNLFAYPNVSKVLNVRFAVWFAARFGPMEGQGLTGLAEAEAVTGTRMQDGQPYEVVYELPTLDRARLVAAAEIVDDDASVQRVIDPTFDPSTTAVLAPSDESAAVVAGLGGGIPTGEVEWLEQGTDRSRLRVTSDRAALLVVSENWYPTWHATVDGSDAPVLRAYHTLQAVPVPAGEHEVVLEVRTDGPVKTGLLLSGVCWLLLAGLAGAGRMGAGRRSSASVDAPSDAASGA